MPGDDHLGDRKNSGLDRWRWLGLVGACALGAGLAWSAPALAGGDPGAPDKGGVPLPRAGEAPVQIIQGQPATGQPATARAVSTLPRGSGDVVYVVSGEGTNVYSLKDYLAAQASGTELTGTPPATAPPATPPATVIESEPTVVDQPAMPVSPPGLGARSDTAPTGPSLQTAAAEPDGDGLGGFLSEVRIGAMAHDVGVFGRSKEDGVDVNAELLFVSPDFLEVVFSPRPHIGVTVSTEGGTSQVYAGLAWDWTFWDPFFVEATLAIAVHDGKISSQAPDEKSLGCRALFRESVSVGARFLEHHSVSVMFTHMSNANLCDNNEGLDAFGVRYGYEF